MENTKKQPTIGEVASLFLAGLDNTTRKTSQPVIMRFVAWYGREKPLVKMTAPEVASYAEQMSRAEVDYSGKLALVRAFIRFTHNKGWLKNNMAIHLKATKKKSLPARRRPKAQPLAETKQGLEEMNQELAKLKEKRLKTIGDIRIAAADKDFRENAPFHAAREQLSLIEGRIRELEAKLKLVVVIEENNIGEVNRKEIRIGVGDSVLLHDITSGQKLSYVIVSPREVNPSKGKISSASPVGKTIIGCSIGEEVEITTPAAKLRYRIEQIDR
jgi:transcription elongation factor GreA